MRVVLFWESLRVLVLWEDAPGLKIAAWRRFSEASLSSTFKRNNITTADIKYQYYVSVHKLLVATTHYDRFRFVDPSQSKALMAKAESQLFVLTIQGDDGRCLLMYH